METKYFVAEAYRYAESGSWEYSLKGMYSTLAEAKQAFHARMAAIIKPSNDHAMVIVYDCYGNKIMSDYDHTEAEPDETETE